MSEAIFEEAERLYSSAQRDRTAAVIQGAIEYHRQICEALDVADTDRAFEYTRRIHEMLHWTAEK